MQYTLMMLSHAKVSAGIKVEWRGSLAVPKETSCEATRGWCYDVSLCQGWCVPWVPFYSGHCVGETMELMVPAPLRPHTYNLGLLCLVLLPGLLLALDERWAYD